MTNIEELKIQPNPEFIAEITEKISQKPNGKLSLDDLDGVAGGAILSGTVEEWMCKVEGPNADCVMNSWFPNANSVAVPSFLQNKCGSCGGYAPNYVSCLVKISQLIAAGFSDPNRLQTRFALDLQNSA
jgi:hypothetical protein